MTLTDLNHLMIAKSRPITPVKLFDEAFEKVGLSKSDQELIEYIRYMGTFDQVRLKQSLKLKQKPPALSILCEICRKLGDYMPEHFSAVRKWSKEISEHGVCWDGDLICSVAFNIDGLRLTPESGTTQYHTFAVHKELFQGFSIT